jgi:energy-coupling factor transporter ATP-binding protein EcfA2
MLLYFRAENYKCLERVEFPLTPIHVLIGRNDSGKTSVLEAMLSYMASTNGTPVHHALSGWWHGKELIYHGAEAGAQISLAALGDRSLAPKDATQGNGPKWDLFGYGFSLAFDHTRGQWIVGREWSIARRESQLGGRAEETVQELPGKDLHSAKPTFLRGQGKELKEVETELKLPRGMLGPGSLYRLDPRILAVPAMPDASRKFRLDHDGFGLSTLLDDIIGYDPELFLRLRKSFLGFFPMFKSVRIETATACSREYQPEVEPLRQTGAGKEILFETQWGKVVRARQASEGALLFLAFLALVHLPAPHRPKLLLLEEPERGVYPKKLEELIQSLKKWVEENAADATQVVMATHSPYVLSFFEPEQVTFLARSKTGGVRARPLRDAPNIRERLSGGFYLGELWFNLSEEELFGNAQA